LSIRDTVAKTLGAIGLGGLREKDVILPIAQQVASLLEQQGIQAVMTRTSDYFVDLAPRATMAERAMPTYLSASMLMPSVPSRPDVSGLETYYYSSGHALPRPSITTFYKVSMLAIAEFDRHDFMC
jgi:N-acetylmuramoyl-L-alanine amidase